MKIEIPGTYGLLSVIMYSQKYVPNIYLFETSDDGRIPLMAGKSPCVEPVHTTVFYYF